MGGIGWRRNTWVVETGADLDTAALRSAYSISQICWVVE